MFQPDPHQPVASIVLEHPHASKVFQAFRIDFCCHGEQVLAEACARAGVDPGEVTRALQQALSQEASSSAEPDARQLSTGALIEAIEQRHHSYLRAELPRLQSMAAKVAYVHGLHNPKLVDLHQAVIDFAAEVPAHLEHEEGILFPSLTSGSPDGAYVREHLERMAVEHEAIGAALERIRDLAEDFRVPEWGCATYRAYFSALQELEVDVMQHVHLENHVLMPRFMNVA
jgi:regulator of cell morphogenesis and NO signaling